MSSVHRGAPVHSGAGVRSLVVDLSAAADRLPEAFRAAHPEIDWRGIRAARNFIAHEYDGTDEDILWQAIAVQFPAIVAELTASPDR